MEQTVILEGYVEEGNVFLRYDITDIILDKCKPILVDDFYYFDKIRVLSKRVDLKIDGRTYDAYINVNLDDIHNKLKVGNRIIMHVREITGLACVDYPEIKPSITRTELYSLDPERDAIDYERDKLYDAENPVYEITHRLSPGMTIHKVKILFRKVKLTKEQIEGDKMLKDYRITGIEVNLRPGSNYNLDGFEIKVRKNKVIVVDQNDNKSIAVMHHDFIKYLEDNMLEKRNCDLKHKIKELVSKTDIIPSISYRQSVDLDDIFGG